MQLAAGQGKSIILILAMQILHSLFSEDYTKFMLLTANRVLKHQYDEIIRNHEIDVPIDIDYRPDFDSQGVYNLYVVDEADYFIRSYSASFRD